MLKRKMITWFMLAVVMVGWSSVANAQEAAPVAPPQAIDYSEGLMLVQATTTAFRTGKDSDFDAPEFKGERAPQSDHKLDYSVQTITHVYCGPSILLNQTFNYPDHRDYSREGFGRAGGNYPYPDQIGTTGIWCLQPKEEVDDPIIPTRYGFSSIILFPALEAQTLRYDQIKALAQTVEKIGQAKPEQQEQFLREDARSPIPEIANWAINTLVCAEPQTIAHFLRDLWADPKLPLTTQTTIDRILCDSQGLPWQEATERLTSLHQWVSMKLSELDINWLLGYFADAWQEGYITPTDLLDLLKTAMSNHQWPVTSQVEAVDIIEAMYDAKRLDEATAFSFYSDQLKKTKAPQVQLAAAQALSRLTLTLPQLVAVHDLLRQVTDPQTLKVLQQVVATPKP